MYNEGDSGSAPPALVPVGRAAAGAGNFGTSGNDTIGPSPVGRIVASVCDGASTICGNDFALAFGDRDEIKLMSGSVSEMSPIEERPVESSSAASSRAMRAFSSSAAALATASVASATCLLEADLRNSRAARTDLFEPDDL